MTFYSPIQIHIYWSPSIPAGLGQHHSRHHYLPRKQQAPALPYTYGCQSVSLQPAVQGPFKHKELNSTTSSTSHCPGLSDLQTPLISPVPSSGPLHSHGLGPGCPPSHPVCLSLSLRCGPPQRPFLSIATQQPPGYSINAPPYYGTFVLCNHTLAYCFLTGLARVCARH